MQFQKLSPSNSYVDVDGVPTPVEDLQEPAKAEDEPPKPKLKDTIQTT